MSNILETTRFGLRQLFPCLAEVNLLNSQDTYQTLDRGSRSNDATVGTTSSSSSSMQRLVDESLGGHEDMNEPGIDESCGIIEDQNRNLHTDHASEGMVSDPGAIAVQQGKKPLDNLCTTPVAFEDVECRNIVNLETVAAVSHIGVDNDVSSIAADSDLECSICYNGSETHKCVPCGHQGCHGCLSEWKSTHNTCMMCMAHVDRLEKIIVTSSTPVDRDDGIILCKKLEMNLDRLLRDLLRIKNILIFEESCILRSLKHLNQLAHSVHRGRVVSQGEIQSVAAVEILSIGDSLTKISNLYLTKNENMNDNNGEQNTTGWMQAEVITKTLIEQLHSALDSDGSRLQDSGKVIPQLIKEYSTSIYAQHDAIQTLFRTCLENALPQAFQTCGFFEMFVGVSIPNYQNTMVVWEHLQKTSSRFEKKYENLQGQFRMVSAQIISTLDE